MSDALAGSLALTPTLIGVLSGCAVMLGVGMFVRAVRHVDAWRRHGESVALVKKPALPLWLRCGLPLARALAGKVGPHLPIRLRSHGQLALRRAGLDEELLPQEWLMLSLVWVSMAILVSLVLGSWSKLVGILGVVIAALPWIWLRDIRKRREQEILRDLPVYLDMLTLALEAGGALSVALKVATERATDSALKQAFLRVQGDLRAGRSRADALRALGERLHIASVTPLIAALVQADSSGGSLAAVLRAQSEQRLNERYAIAEKLAMEAPVKMLLPLVVCIFPCTVLILAFPIVMRFMSAGL